MYKIEDWLVTEELTEFGTFHGVIDAFELKKPTRSQLNKRIVAAEKGIKTRYAFATITARQVEVCSFLLEVLKELGWKFCGQKVNPNHHNQQGNMIYLFFKVFLGRKVDCRPRKCDTYWQGATKSPFDISYCCCGFRYHPWTTIFGGEWETPFLSLTRLPRGVPDKGIQRLKKSGWHMVHSRYGVSFWSNGYKPKKAGGEKNAK